MVKQSTFHHKPNYNLSCSLNCVAKVEVLKFYFSATEIEKVLYESVEALHYSFII